MWSDDPCTSRMFRFRPLAPSDCRGGVDGIVGATVAAAVVPDDSGMLTVLRVATLDRLIGC